MAVIEVRKALDPLDLEFQAGVSCSVWKQRRGFCLSTQSHTYRIGGIDQTGKSGFRSYDYEGFLGNADREVQMPRIYAKYLYGLG